MPLQERLSLVRAPVFLMDGAAFIYRGYYANRKMQRSDGFPTSALLSSASLPPVSGMECGPLTTTHSIYRNAGR